MINNQILTLSLKMSSSAKTRSLRIYLTLLWSFFWYLMILGSCFMIVKSNMGCWLFSTVSTRARVNSFSSPYRTYFTIFDYSFIKSMLCS